MIIEEKIKLPHSHLCMVAIPYCTFFQLLVVHCEVLYCMPTRAFRHRRLLYSHPTRHLTVKISLYSLRNYHVWKNLWDLQDFLNMIKNIHTCSALFIFAQLWMETLASMRPASVQILLKLLEKLEKNQKLQALWNIIHMWSDLSNHHGITHDTSTAQQEVIIKWLSVDRLCEWMRYNGTT